MKNKNPEDFSNFIKNERESRKERLIKECEKHDIPIYVDDKNETSSGAYAEIRAVVSEAELERRLNTKKATKVAGRSNIIAIIALIVSALTFMRTFFF